MVQVLAVYVQVSDAREPRRIESSIWSASQVFSYLLSIDRSMSLNDRPLSFIDLFAAPGGLSLGFEFGGFRSMGAIDFDEHGIETYSYNFPHSKALKGDLRNLSPDAFLRESQISKNYVDLVIGSPPCQGLSVIGRVKISSLIRNGIWELKNHNSRFIDDPRNLLYLKFLEYIREIKPKYFVMENVWGIKSYMDGEFLDEMKENFRQIGYDQVSELTLDAVDFGVPQSRKRVFIVGNRLGIPTSFAATIEESVDKPVSVWEAIGDLPPIGSSTGKDFLNYTEKASNKYQEWCRNGSQFVRNHITRKHSERDALTFQSMKPGERWQNLKQEIKDLYGYRDDIFRDKFRKLPIDSPSWTITAHLSKDGYAFIHPVENRTITVREAARLQSFPDTFVFLGPRTSQFKQVGNSVPPLLARSLALRIRESLV